MEVSKKKVSEKKVLEVSKKKFQKKKFWKFQKKKFQKKKYCCNKIQKKVFELESDVYDRHTLMFILQITKNKISVYSGKQYFLS